MGVGRGSELEFLCTVVAVNVASFHATPPPSWWYSPSPHRIVLHFSNTSVVVVVVVFVVYLNNIYEFIAANTLIEAAAAKAEAASANCV